MKHNFTYIELKTQSCSNVGVQLVNAGDSKKSSEFFIKNKNNQVNNTFLDAKRAKDLAFKLLSLARKIERSSE